MSKILLLSSMNEQICIDMIYQGEKGKLTQRRIRVTEIQDHHIKAYCYLRHSLRLFKIENILAVATIRRSGARKGA